MRSFISHSFWTVLVLAGLSTLTNAALIDRSCDAEITCGTGRSLADVQSRQVSPSPTLLDSRALTNAERLARGLPLKAPSRRDDGAEFAPRSQPSSTPKKTYTGYVVVKKDEGTQTVSYLKKDPFSTGQLPTTTDKNSALRISFELDEGTTSGSQIDISMLNSAGPLLGLVQGRDNTNSNLASGSFHYLYVVGVSSPGTGPGETPQTIANEYTKATTTPRTAETSVWSVDVTNGHLDLQWINTDGSASLPTQKFLQSNSLYAGGDSGAFASRYPSPVTRVTLSFESATF